MNGEQKEKEGEQKDGEKENKDSQVTLPDWVGGAVVVAVFAIPIAIGYLQSFFRDPDVPSVWKTAAVVGLVLLGVGSVTIGWKWLTQRFATVAWFTNIVAFLVSIGLTIVPVFLFRREDQIFFLKVLLIVVLSVLPGLLFLQFLAVRRQTLWGEFLHNLRRLGIDYYGPLPDPEVATAHEQGGVDDLAAPEADLYTKKFEAIYGKTAWVGGERRTRLQGESVVPMLVTTILLAVGWTLALEPEPIADLRLLPEDLQVSGRPVLPYEALRFGFAGSYFFILQMVVRRYFQDDLKANAYISSVNRIVLVAILVVAVSLVVPRGTSQDTVAALGFLIGVFPQIGLQIIHGAVSKTFSWLRLIRLEPDYPLGELDGLTVWDEARLLEEGVEDLQNLASANLVELMLRTRLPVERLVDWVDQAHLYLRLPPQDGNSNARSTLRAYGIRTATDLIDAFQPKSGSNSDDPEVHRIWEEAIEETDVQDVLNGLRDLKLGTSIGGPSQLLTILKTLKNEPNLHLVRHWKGWRPD
jgi:hypothetical protein